MRLSTIILCALAAFGLSLAEVKNPDAKPRDLWKSDFFAKALKSEKGTETWSYQFVFDNGTRAYVNYSLLVVPTSGKKIGCDISFQNFKGKNSSVGRQYPPERLVEDREKSRISIKEEYLMEGFPGKGHRVLFTADKNGKFLLDLTFSSAKRGKVPGNGEWKVEGKSYGEAVLIPFGRVSGKIAHDADTVEVSGYGYLEHTWQSGNATDFAVRAFNFSETTRGAYAGRIAITENGEPFGYVIEKNSAGTRILLPKAILENGKPYDGEHFPKAPLQIVWQNSDDTLSLDFTKPKQKFSMLENFDGWIAKKAAKIMLGGDMQFWRGRSKNPDGLVFDWSITGL